MFEGNKFEWNDGIIAETEGAPVITITSTFERFRRCHTNMGRNVRSPVKMTKENPRDSRIALRIKQI